MPITITTPRVIVCEGGGDVAFFKALIKARNLPQYDVCQPQAIAGVGSGKDGFGTFLQALPLQSGFAAVKGVLVVGDNDADPAASFQHIQSQIQAAGGFGIPVSPLEVARSQEKPPIVVMMLPWTSLPGNLETLCLDAMYAAHNHLKDCIDDYCTCTGISGWDIAKQSKMRMRCLMSSICQSDPDVPLSGAWSHRETIVSLEHRAFDRVGDFLNGFDNRIAPS